MTYIEVYSHNFFFLQLVSPAPVRMEDCVSQMEKTTSVNVALDMKEETVNIVS